MAGRKSKGDRHAFMTRIPRAAADRLIEDAERLDVSFSELIAMHVAHVYGVEMDVPTGSSQWTKEELPLPTAS